MQACMTIRAVASLASVVTSARAEVEKKLAILDTQLAKREYVAGSAITMGDIPLACSIDRWYKLPLTHETHSNVERWFKTVSARKGAEQVVQLALA